MVAISSTSLNTIANKSSDNNLIANALINLKPNLISSATNTSIITNTNTIQNDKDKNSDLNKIITSPSHSKSQFKTVKVFVASNKNEFNHECDCLIQEAQIELQQHYLQYGYDLYFIDVNLNYDLDPFIDPYLFKSMINEIDECSRFSDACFFLVLLGNKNGLTPLPLEIAQAEYANIKTAVPIKEFEFLNSWYYLDDNSTSPCYRLKPLIKSFPNLYNRTSDSEFKKDLDSLQETHSKLIDILKNSVPDKYQVSGVELLTQAALKNSATECFVIQRNIDAIDLSKKNSEKYVDLLESGKIDKKKEEKQNKFKEFIFSKLDETSKFKFNIKWKAEYGDITNEYTRDHEKENEVESDCIDDDTGAKFKRLKKSASFISQISWHKYDDDFKSYLQGFNSAVITHIKALLDKKIKLETSLTKRINELFLYQEATRHFKRFEELSELGSIESNDYGERLKKLISNGAKVEHNPIFLYGSQLSGKTTMLTKFGDIALKTIDSKSHFAMIVRYSDLTSQCSTFDGLLYSICEHLCLILKLNPINEIKTKEVSSLVEYFYKICGQISKNQMQILILIDDIQDINTEKPLASKLSSNFNQINWLFYQVLPPGIHLIVSIKAQINSSNSNTKILENEHAAKRLSTTSANVTVNSATIVPLFFFYYSEKMSQEADSCLFELPLQYKVGENSELALFIKSEFTKVGRNVNEEQLQMIIKYFNLNAKSNIDVNNNLNINSKNEIHYNLLYLNLVIKEATLNREYNDFRKFFSDERFPKDLETCIRYKIENIERKYNSKIIGYLFNYITASHNGVTEIELMDLLSCNNDFFTEYYHEKRLPDVLRFPIAFWLLIKYQLYDFFSIKFLDNKVTFSWRHESVKKIMKIKYFNKVDQIRSCHKDVAMYFLETYIESKPLIDMSRNTHLRDDDAKRYICQQPLLYSDVRYNLRRMNELWYHLMNSGDVQRLKEFAFFNFEHLLAKCHGMSLKSLLNDLDAVLRRILDSDILLISSMLKRSYVTLSRDPLCLGSEILARLRPLQDDYSDHIKSLISQATSWSEQHESPVLVPLSNWLDSPENLLITRIDHSEGIFKVAVTSFNQHVFFTTSTNEICMFHIPSKKLVRKFSGHTNIINFLLLSYNNRYLISGSSDKLIRIWNLGTGEIENTFSMHKAPILCGIITHSDEYLITGSYNRMLTVIRVETGDVIHSMEQHFDAIIALAISQDDSILISASVDKSIKRWSFEDMQLIDTISGIYSPITNMVITPDNTFVILACENANIQVKSLITGSDIHDLVGHQSTVTNLTVSADSERLYVGCSDAKLYLYDIKSKELISILIEQEASINDLRISADSSFLFSSSGDSLYVLSLKKKDFMSKRKKSMTNDLSKLIKVSAISKEGDLALTGEECGRVNLWNIINAELMVTIIEPPPPESGIKISVSKLALSNSRLFSLIAFTNCTVIVYDNEMGDVVTVFSEHLNPVKYLNVFEDNRRVMSSDANNSCKIWVAHSGQLLESITVACEMFGLSPDMKYCVSGPGKNTLKLWGLNDSQVIRTIDHPERITVYAFTGDSKYVITGGDDCSCKIWELTTGKLVQVLVEHDGSITSIAIPSSNLVVISGSKDKLAIIWNFKDGSVIHKLLIHQDIIVKVAITPDGNVAITASRDGTVNVWGTRNGNLLTSMNLQYTLINLLVSTDCNRMVACFKDCNSLSVIGLTNRWIKEHIRSLSHSSLKSIDNKNDVNPGILPIKPKPLKIKRTITTVAHFFPDDVLNKEDLKNVTNDAEANAQAINQNESQATVNKSTGGLFQRIKKKKQKPEYSSTVSMANNESKPQKKTKICCIL